MATARDRALANQSRISRWSAQRPTHATQIAIASQPVREMPLLFYIPSQWRYRCAADLVIVLSWVLVSPALPMPEFS
jgi:hypothetical protein